MSSRFEIKPTLANLYFNGNVYHIEINECTRLSIHMEHTYDIWANLLKQSGELLLVNTEGCEGFFQQFGIVSCIIDHLSTYLSNINHTELIGPGGTNNRVDIFCRLRIIDPYKIYRSIGHTDFKFSEPKEVEPKILTRFNMMSFDSLI